MISFDWRGGGGRYGDDERSRRGFVWPFSHAFFTLFFSHWRIEQKSCRESHNRVKTE